MNKRINVTEPALPSLSEFHTYLERIWDKKWLTNNGDFHQELEIELAKFLKVKHLSLFSNGTIALIVALKALEIHGEVITTPYSFIATAHSLIWNNIDPVFCDIQQSDCNIDCNKIEKLITEKTSAILPVHVYGNPCNHKKINLLARKHNLKVLYDSAHAFGVEENNHSILNYGDLSVLSFHATKVFNTFEGGAIISHSAEMKERIDLLKNFGISDEVSVKEVGINGKMNEFQSALGLLQLKNIKENINKRKLVADFYRSELNGFKEIKTFEERSNVHYNFSYFPVLVETMPNRSRDGLYEYLKKYNIYSRRYFYPLISSFETYKNFPSSKISNLKNANFIAKRILCLPIFPDLALDTVKEICDLIKGYYEK